MQSRLNSSPVLLLQGVRLSAAAVVVFLSALFAAGSAAGQTTLRDPGGRFTLAVPKDWSVAASSEQMSVLVSGNSSMSVTVGNLPPGQMVESVSGQVATQWGKYQELKRGPATVGGKPAELLIASGTNPKGQPSFFRVVAAPFSGGTLVMMTSTPQDDFARHKAAIESMEKGVRFADGGAEPSPARSVPSVSPEKKRKLEALEQAHMAGVLSDDEYAQKKAALLASAEPAARPAPSRRTADESGTPAPAAGRPMLGVATRALEADDVQMTGVDKGALVAQVAPGSPADAAGIQPGDVVVSFDGAPVTDAQSLVQAVGRSKPGQQITLGLVRGGRSGNVQVRLGTVPR